MTRGNAATKSITINWGDRWDSYFMTLVYFAATQSKDESTHVGAVIVNKEKRVLSMGYNSFPAGIDDNIPERQERPEKYFFFAHAERNAIYSAAQIGVPLKDSIMYTAGMPCADCGIAIIQSGIREVVLHSPWDASSAEKWVESHNRTKEMFLESGVHTRYYSGKLREMTTLQRGKPIGGI